MTLTQDSPAAVAAMARALELAGRGPSGNPNPQVGCVILDANGETVAEGWHQGAGTPHAEVMAIANLAPEWRNHDNARQLTAVVTLEPCNHTGRTGPCAEAILSAGIGSVIYAVSDTGVASGGGAQRLMDAGVTVSGGLLANEVSHFIGPWLTFARTGRPHVILKWASSLDGRAAANDGTSQWITGPEARADVHVRRSAVDAIVVGTGTALADNPSLTARYPDGTLMLKQPIPVVVGKRSIPADAALHAHPQSPIIFHGTNLDLLLHELGDRGIRTVLVEGGPTLASAFIRAGLVDEVHAYLAPVLLGGSRLALDELGVATIDQAIRLTPFSTTVLGNDVRIIAHPIIAHPAALHHDSTLSPATATKEEN
ncbi:bifunctional diaminohydroxyphosphoribosylaminopyrimidine deaminase/5-amino-6-(5-phosphoribosylamino)uracil reductase RibD [Lysinibacter cavernae]|uniref:Riboflavin biosynthesis protein RibD n=1 Tax=Lysinibacter cavernae TaxID=1640652 RepID=A0A7X5R3Y9_9MICO|nr:bifunctional diaminohydroxyphosphoribosylaminopyrimidine deaminase/5-amino-6-(5-phosphoribosylamino)uracil reductase RibD [Lysinibacter cavernae]NIH55186.1 diaminohydroxyphosphoribosylaminopyrimidine deaminase/5-amino-6-(5-phosphoribosylamino)uracil reductase [Lysinibacter cavernae]